MLRSFKRYKPHQKIVSDLTRVQNSSVEASKISISESFKQFMEKTIPSIEKEVEVRILSSIYHKLKNESVKQELLNAYKRRQLDLHFHLIKPEVEVEEKKLVREEKAVELDIFANDITNVSIEDVHKFYDFPLLEYHYMFPCLNFGYLYHVERVLSRSLKFAVQMTPEAFKIVKMLEKQMDLKTTTLQQLNVLDELELCDTVEDLEALYTNRSIYLKLTYLIGDSLREVLREHRFSETSAQLFTHSFLYDTIVNILVWQMHRKEVRELLLNPMSRDTAMKTVVSHIMSHPDCKYFQPYNTKNWIELQKFLKLSDNVTVDLEDSSTYWNRNPKKSQSYFFEKFIGYNSNILIWGVEGCGKSGLLTTIAMWARANGWVVFKIPSVYAITQSLNEELLRHPKSRLYLNPTLSVKILEDFYVSNKEKLADISVDLNLYGKYNALGVHKEESNPVPNFFIKDREVYFYDSDQFVPAKELEDSIRRTANYDRNLLEELPEPKNLLEIAEYALEDSELATNALAEIKEQLYHTQDAKVLVAVDDYNWFFRPSKTPSFRYVNMKSLNGYVPPYHIALCRLFMDFDGHKIANGFKVAATSNYSIRRHYFEPGKINFPETVSMELKGMNVKSLANFKHFAYLHNMDYMTGHKHEDFKRFWMETQGNYKQLIYLLAYPDMSVYKWN